MIDKRPRAVRCEWKAWTHTASTPTMMPPASTTNPLPLPFAARLMSTHARAGPARISCGGAAVPPFPFPPFAVFAAGESEQRTHTRKGRERAWTRTTPPIESIRSIASAGMHRTEFSTPRNSTPHTQATGVLRHRRGGGGSSSGKAASLPPADKLGYVLTTYSCCGRPQQEGPGLD